uniref:LPD23 domain-containing protein n=3 Tax=Campylobacter concisus TaxID=199 RepID=UPI001CB749A4
HSHTDTKPAGALKLEQDARLARDSGIIPQKDKNTKTINASPHIASGLLGGTANGADENGNVSPEEFAKGFIYALFGSKITAEGVKRVSPELYNSILGLGKKMPQMAKDNPKLLTKIYGSAKSNSINSFAGEKALNASANKLSKAKAMLEKVEDEVKIWQSTGWYKDKDGAWKFEIDDSPAKIKNQNADKLGDLLEHKELFKAYPELKDIKIKKIIDEKGEKLGYYDPNKKEIAINNIGDKSTLMHEVQHAIQNIEGFARGGEYDTVWNAAVRTIEKKYENELAKLEKIANETWKKEEPLQKAYIELFDKGLKDSPEAQRLLKEMEPYFKKGMDTKNKIRNIKWAIEDEKNAITDKDMYEAYQKIHGEVEARNVQNRLT